MRRDGRISAIILAGGVGERFGVDLPKQFIMLAGKPIICHTIEVFEKNASINEIVLVVNEGYIDVLKGLVSNNKYQKVSQVVVGGITRQESSLNGLKACSSSTTHVLIHDAVRPFIDDDIIDRCLEALKTYDAVDVCLESTDTVVEVDEQNDIVKIPKRSAFKRGQTPQAFRFETILKAHQYSMESGITDSTDDCNLLLRAGLAKVHVIPGSEYNIKITHPIDIHLAEKIFQMREMHLSLMPKEIISERLRGKIIVVVGGRSGIGESICNLGDQLGLVTVPFSRSNGMDVRSPSDIKLSMSSVANEHGRIDAVVICSAVLHHGPLESAKDNEIIDLVSINLTGNALVAKYAIPYLRKTKGKIVFFASSSYTRGREGYAAYSATKAGVVNIMQAISDELSGEIGVLAINPQRTKTPMRSSNFGKEDEHTLLSPEFVALQTLNAMAADDYTGCVIDVKLSDEQSYNRINPNHDRHVIL